MASKIYTSVLFFSPLIHTHTANPSVCRLLLFLLSVLFSTLSLLFIFIIALILMALAKRFVHRTDAHDFVAIVELELVFFGITKRRERWQIQSTDFWIVIAKVCLPIFLSFLCLVFKVNEFIEIFKIVTSLSRSY